MNNNYSEKQKNALVRELKKAGADTVFVVFDRIINNDGMLYKFQEKFIRNKNFLEENGFDVGAWLAPTIGYGGSGGVYGDNGAQAKYTVIKGVNGQKVNGTFCPLDDNFVEDFLNTFRAVAKTGVKEILLEDDFALTGGKGIAYGLSACCCELHMKKLCEELGEELTVEDVYKKVFHGGKNKYRDAWIKVQGDTLRELAAKIEKAVHSVDSDIRIGMSANVASYDMECVELPELAKIIAGDTKPFIRLTGAPYWQNAKNLAANIETARVQARWCEEIEVWSEGDTYPRPRYWIPSSYLEGFDMILRADGKCDGILKYMIDYNSSADYETGYIEAHCRNQKHYEEIDRRFSGKESVGLNLFEKMSLFEHRELGEDITIEQLEGRGHLPLMSQWFVTDNSIPVTYNGENCASLVFGENAKFLDEEKLKNGVILDAMGARFLYEKGIDIGIKGFKKAGKPVYETFLTYDERTISTIEGDGAFYNFELKDNAEVLSMFTEGSPEGLATIADDGKNKNEYPACFRYENEKGQKFMIYSFVPKRVFVVSGWQNGLFRNYCRQRQLADGIKWLQGKPLPAMSYKHPELYILCKKDEISMAVGLWNLFADSVFDPEIVLDGEYKSIDFYNCSGKLCGDKVRLDNDIMPYGFAFFTVTK